MTIKALSTRVIDKMEIDLTGPDGNAYSLMGNAEWLCRQLGIDSKTIIADMMSGDYEHLVKVFDANFGEYVDLYR